ncbi:MAG: hypothetical protein KAZ88_00960 [Acidimicrobiia bacterium]|jgi:hypothetical protein|nr:hypothetical protein [Acidimicrobiia bacterium]MBP8179545.1 hypothetical protein [Acidimicrobiia bacterium]
MSDANSNNDDNSDNALELAFFAPIGLAAIARDTVPPLIDSLVERGRSEISASKQRLDMQITQAKMIGQFAVQAGVPMLRQRIDQQIDSVRQQAGQLTSAFFGGDDPKAEQFGSTAVAPEQLEATAAQAAKPPAPAAETTIQEAALPIADYDQLAASQVVKHLSGLSTADLEAVRTYESENRNRKTVLNKVDQLLTR